ncbi:24 kDa protein [Rehmannia virus 1]|uniref:24 kDa protein n=1 Tax=Rehmannia virus 1 TaxID=2316740 RepID=A0A385HW51_9CLOS|nr:24 kDa protein [Rehmannia virus 1]AXY55037.1 24 kDa protein [Rehmannia virus 1]
MALTVSNDNSTSSLLNEKDLTSEIVEKFAAGLDLNTISQSSDSSFSRTELDEALPSVLGKIREITKADSKQDAAHFMMLMFRAAVVTTSPKVRYTGSYSYSVSGVSYQIKDADVFPHISHLLAKFRKPNPLRAFFSCFETPYVYFCKLNPEMAENRTACRRGTPHGYGYLAADFLPGSSSALNDRERAIINKASEHAINRSNMSSLSREIVSLYDI